MRSIKWCRFPRRSVHRDVAMTGEIAGVVMTGRSGGELIQDFLSTYEIPFVFGNPGTTEVTFLAAMAASKATYVLSLHESSAVGIAAGYVLITGKPSVVSLHTYPGLANGMFNMRNALMAGVPLLLINGQQIHVFSSTIQCLQNR
jgi:benzoylformate decarboxylase